MHNKAILIVHYLANVNDEYVTSFQLSNYLNSSTRTVLRYISEIQSESHAYGFEIVSRKGQGYHLEIIDPEAFQNYLSKSMMEQKKDGLTKLEYLVARQLLLSGSVKLDDLATQFNYSRSSMSRVTTAVSSIFEGYNLKLESKAHQGLSVHGSEILLRHCISNLFFHDVTMQQSALMLGVEDVDLSKMKAAASGEAASRHLFSFPDAPEQFLKYFLITVNRVRSKNYVNFEHVAEAGCDIVSAESLDFISELLQLVLPEFESKPQAQWEILYLALAWEQNFNAVKKLQDYGPGRVRYITRIVDKAMENIKNYYGVDFSKNTPFMEELAEHISSCYGDYLLSIESESLYLDEVRAKYPTAYYYSVEVAVCISENTKTKIPDDKLALITLHFAAAIEGQTHSRKIKAAILCQTKFGTAALLESRIKKQYNNIDIVAVHSLDEAKNIRVYVDFYISTIPMETKSLGGKPVFQLSPFLNEQDCKLLDDIIAKLSNTVSAKSICLPNHFYILNKPGRKSHLLNYLCDRLLQEGRITEKEKADIFARETLVSTEIAPRVAMPHCIIQGPSFLVFAILPNPVIWDQNKVNLIVLGCFRQGDTEIKQLLKQLYKVISDRKQVDRMIGCKSYEEFIDVTNDFIGEELC